MRRERVDVKATDSRQSGDGEALAEHGGIADEHSIIGREAVESRSDERGERLRNGKVG